MADYSEFPTTPTAWQEQVLDPALDPAATPAPAAEPAIRPGRRRPDLTTLIPGLVFVLLAVLGMAGVDFSLALFEDGGVLWAVLIGLGVALLISEVRRARRRD